MSKVIYIAWIILLFGFLLIGCNPEDDSIQEERTELLMRKIGHELLLANGDTFSVVKPVIKEGNKYRIQFATEFGFVPDSLVTTINTVMVKSQNKSSYFVEVKECESKSVVYSYEMEIFSDTAMIPCKTREQPIGCYELQIKLNNIDAGLGYRAYWWLLILPFLLLTIVIKKTIASKTKQGTYIGKYFFNKNKLSIVINGTTTELTQKEAELLDLLYNNLNNPVKRETILNLVWEDEGDYIGRTLDVFISKLRKKLEEDPNIEIRNIRGIGYKLLIN